MNKKNKVRLMGILNVTPDSFYDGSFYSDTKSALRRAECLVKEGADIIDVGGESSRPGASSIDEKTELARVLPIIKAIARKFNKVAISIDTQKAEVARQALSEGANIVNDISALRFDAKMATVVAQAKAKVILMHMRQTPQTMQRSPKYKNVVAEVVQFLSQRIQWALHQGIAKKNIWIDPGIGFGKTLEHNLSLLRHLKKFKKLNAPIVLGCSRKSFIGLLDDGAPVSERLPGSLAAACWAAQQGVSILRVHDIAPTRQSLRVINSLTSIA